MGASFFGQFLIESGAVDSTGLQEALQLMERENPTIGDLAVQAGFATKADCDRVTNEQNRVDLSFGELAQEMGVLNSIELEEILQNQLETRVNVGDALVRLGQLSREQLAEFEDLYKRKQAGVQAGDTELPKALVANRLARTLVDLLPRMCMRTAQLEVQLENGRELGVPDTDSNLLASIMMIGTPALEVLIAAEMSFARKLSAGLVYLPEESLSAELCLDGLGEFLNVLGGAAITALGKRGIEYRLETPRYGQFPRQGSRFTISSEWGNASLILIEH